MGTKFSPAWPIAATEASGPICWLISTVVRRIPCPQRRRASLISTFPSATWSHTGRSALPSMMMASNPAYLSSAAKWPPMCPLATRGFGQQVGHRVVTAVLPLQGAPVPAKGPTPKTTLLAGSKGLVPIGTSSHITLYPIPVPPKKSLYFSMVSSVEILPVDKSTRRTFPVHPPCLAIFLHLLYVTSYGNRCRSELSQGEQRPWVSLLAAPCPSGHARLRNSGLQRDRPRRTWDSHRKGNTWWPCLYPYRRTTSPRDKPSDTFCCRYICWG